MKYSKRFYENQEQVQSQVQGQESQGQGNPTVDKLADTFKSIGDEKINMKVSEFVEKFKKIADDDKVQAILKSGKTDGSPDDERLAYSEGNISVTSLLPTQSEIGFDESVKNILTDKYGSLKSILDGNADVGGPIVIYNSRYIIDGHHRWSQVYAANPKAKMVALNIIGNLKPTEVLKAVHAAIALKVGKVPSSDPEGINILEVSSNDLKKNDFFYLIYKRKNKKII